MQEALPPSPEPTAELPAPPPAARRALAAAVDLWGGSWEEDGRRVVLPVQAGLRHGRLVGQVEVVAARDGSRVRLYGGETSWRLHWAALVILLCGALGGLALVAWPWVPALVPFLPVGLVLAIGAWLLVAARVRHRGPAELFATARELLARDLVPAENADDETASDPGRT